jgi:hypothetical protein
VARIIVMPDASQLKLGIKGTVLYAEHVCPEQLDDLHASEQILERLERAVREAGPPRGHERPPTRLRRWEPTIADA